MTFPIFHIPRLTHAGFGRLFCHPCNIGNFFLGGLHQTVVIIDRIRTRILAFQHEDLGFLTHFQREAHDEQEVLLFIEDTGRRMPPEVRDSLFSAAAVSHKPGRTGLGTKIVKDVIDTHGGTIMVDSVEGRGPRFVFVFPRVDHYIQQHECHEILLLYLSGIFEY